MDIVTSVVIIDVLANPELTLTKRIFVTPSLVIRYVSGPETLIVGDLTDRQKIETALCRTLESQGPAADTREIQPLSENANAN